jgi:heptosyltransferase-1
MLLRLIIRTIVDLSITFESLFICPEKHPNERRILILRKDGLGDCLIFYPTLKAYREFYKDAQITLVFPSIFKSLEPLLSNMDHVIWFDHAAFRSDFKYRRSFMHNLKRRGYDIAIYPVYSQEYIGNKMMKVTRAEKVFTFDKVKTLNVSELSRNINFAEYITGKKINVNFPTISTESLPEKSFQLPQSKYVMVFPGTSFATYRRWPSERFAEIVKMLIDNDITPVLCGSPKEEYIIKNITDKLSGSARKKILDLSGKTDIADLAHLLKHAEFYFGSDTGILHLAVAVGIPCIGIIGSGGYQRFFPYGDLRRNRAIFDPECVNGVYPLGTWEGAEKLPPGEIHPSIENITLDQARREVDYMLKFLYKKHEKSN